MRKNKVDMLKLEPGIWCTDEDKLREAAKEFCCKLYLSENVSGEAWHLRGAFPTLERSDIEMLAKEVNDEEIRVAVFQMGPLKSPGVDSVPALFFQKHWSSLGRPLCEMIRNIFNGGEFDVEICKTVIVLIPKNEKPESFSHFRPISLCNTVYKIITKVIANRLMQSSFVPGRHIVDNIIITPEVIHSMTRMKGKEGFMAIKMDSEEAYDRLEWNFILDTLFDLGIPGRLVNVIMKCLSSAST